MPNRPIASRPEVLAVLCAAESWIDQQGLSGSAGATDLAVSQAILFVVHRAWEIEVGIAVREGAEITGFSRSTIAISFGRLTPIGFIRRTRLAEGGRPAIYRLVPRVCLMTSCPHLLSGSGPAMHHDENDVFRRKGLGPNARRIWLNLKRNPQSTVTQISLALGIDRTTARRNLNELQRYGLAIQQGTPAKWSHLDRDLNLVARELGTAGSLERQRTQHAVERRAFYLNHALQQTKDNSFQGGLNGKC